MVVLVVGVRPIGHASAEGGSSSTRSAARARAEAGRAVMATSGIAKRRVWATRSASSAVSPLLDSASTASPGTIIPRSPWLASPGWTNREGVPGRRQGRGDLAGDQTGLAHAGDDDPAGAAGQRLDRLLERRTEGVGKCLEPGGLGRQHGPAGGDRGGRLGRRLGGEDGCHDPSMGSATGRVNTDAVPGRAAPGSDRLGLGVGRDHHAGGAAAGEALAGLGGGVAGEATEARAVEGAVRLADRGDAGPGRPEQVPRLAARGGGGGGREALIREGADLDGPAAG